MTLLSSIRIIPGVTVRRNDKRYLILDLVNSKEILAESVDGERGVFPASDFVPDLVADTEKLPDLSAIEDQYWAQALEIYEIIRPIVELGRRERTRSDVERVANEIDRHPATVYRWLTKYESTGLISSLLRKKRKDKGQKRLDDLVESIIEETIQSFYMTGQRRSPTKTGKEVEKRCKEAGLPPPDISTVRNRINEKSEEERTRKREGAKSADEKFEPIKGHFPGADFPLAVVQIDHTPMDVIVVDDEYRLPINRPYLTTAIDVCTKILLGFYISLDPPGALSTGMCLARAILGKEAFLAELGIDDLEWPCWGVMRTVHTDNAKEFKGTMLGKAVELYGIIAERRPKGRPKYGGHVERAFRTYMEEVHNELPGTTFSNVQQKMEYDSEGHAVMTMDALEKWFTIFILGVYHQKPHKGNDDLPPIAKWEQSLFGTDERPGTGIPMRIEDEERLRLDFMPYFERTVQEYGVMNDGITYYTDALRGLIHAKDPKSIKKKRLFVCRYDPRNLSKIWLYEPDSNQYIEVPYSDLSRPPISIWELREAKRRLKEQSLSVTNEELIFKSIDQMRAIVDEESAKTKKARRMRQRKKSWDKATGSNSEKKVEGNKTIPKEKVEEDFSDELEPFDDIRES